MRIMVLALLLSATPAAASSDQFNLVCTGKYQRPAAAQKSGQRIYRMDLSAKTWCIEDCSIVLPIIAVDNARIVLQSYEKYGVRVEPYIDRTTGAVSDTDFDGKCEATAFSGMPIRKF